MAEQPTGTVTLLFADIEGSTALLQRLGAERYADALDQHRRLLRDAFERHGGYEVDYEGDSFFVAFRRAADAVEAATESQQALAAAAWPEELPVRVRMGIHTGEPLATPPKYVGLDVHKAARVMAAGHGGQVLLTMATQAVLEQTKPVRELGTHRLKDLLQPETIYQLLVPGLRDEFPALKTLGNRPTNLPVVATPFVGREDELEALDELLGRDTLRLVTLTGPGGIGKTRLALQAAADAVEQFRDGVYWVPFASLRDPELVAVTVAQTLGLREEAGESILDTLGGYLNGRQLLLVLDNLEHLVGAARELVAHLLQIAPAARVLATSREALRITGEQLYDVKPLAVPEPGDATGSDAVALFVGRAQAADAGFVLDEATTQLVGEIVRRLEGLPLAIELAAARIRALPPAALLDRLDDRLRVLKIGAHDVDERQRTLRATIEWSYDLLTSPEQILFTRLSVFNGGCRLDAAEAVCDPDGELDVLDGVSSLLDKSLLRRDSDSDGQPRYWMLETIGEFAAAAAAEEPRVPAAHASFFAQFAAAAVSRMNEHQREWSDRLDSERDNLRKALRWALAGGHADNALMLAIGYGRLCALRGPLGEGRGWLASAVAAADGGSSSLRQQGLVALAELAERQNDLDSARSYVAEGVELARHSGDQHALARALLAFGLIEADAGNLASAEDLQREALQLFSASGNDRDVRMTLAMLGFLLIVRQRFPEAEQICERALRLSRAANDKRGIVGGASNLGRVRARQGKISDALTLQREALLLSHDLTDVQWVAEMLVDVAGVALTVGDDETAATLVGVVARLGETAQFALAPAYRAWYDEVTSNLRDRIGGAEAERAFAHASHLSQDDVVQLTLEFIDRSLAAIA